jgi:hypothetical protein
LLAYENSINRSKSPDFTPPQWICTHPDLIGCDHVQEAAIANLRAVRRMAVVLTGVNVDMAVLAAPNATCEALYRSIMLD